MSAAIVQVLNKMDKIWKYRYNDAAMMPLM